MSYKSEIMHQVKNLIRQPYAFTGGYQKVLVTSDGGCLCHKCAKSEFVNICDSTIKDIRDGWQAAGVDVNWENSYLYCDNCNDIIPAEYN